MNDTALQIKAACLAAATPDPIELITSIMQKEYIPIHGPVHHILDGACFMTALHNAGLEFDLSAALDEMIVREQKMPGATCGQWGMCGSASSIGAALSIVHGTGPLSSNSYYQDNLRYVAKALTSLAEVGGPRCCKRNAFLSLYAAIDFVKEIYGITLPKREIRCDFFPKNQQCIHARCPFYSEADHA